MKLQLDSNFSFNLINLSEIIHDLSVNMTKIVWKCHIWLEFLTPALWGFCKHVKDHIWTSVAEYRILYRRGKAPIVQIFNCPVIWKSQYVALSFGKCSSTTSVQQNSVLQNSTRIFHEIPLELSYGIPSERNFYRIPYFVTWIL